MIQNAKADGKPLMTAEQFAHLGDGAVAYIRTLRGEEVQKLFPQVGAVQPNVTLYVLLSADGSPIMLTDSKDAAFANALENDLQTVSLH